MSVGKILAAIAIAGVIAELATPAKAQNAHPDWVPLSALQKSLNNLNAFYGKVPSAVDCHQASATRKTVERLICNNPYLMVAELLSARASAYAYENATKTEVDQPTYRISLPENCATEQCVYDWFREGTDGDLGGQSPYYAASHHSAD